MPSVRIAVEVREEDQIVRDASLEFVLVIVGDRVFQQPTCKVRDTKTGVEAIVKFPYGEYANIRNLVSDLTTGNMEELTRKISFILNMAR